MANHQQHFDNDSSNQNDISDVGQQLGAIKLTTGVMSKSKGSFGGAPSRDDAAKDFMSKEEGLATTQNLSAMTAPGGKHPPKTPITPYNFGLSNGKQSTNYGDTASKQVSVGRPSHFTDGMLDQSLSMMSDEKRANEQKI